MTIRSARDLVRFHESCSLEAYQDTGGVWTCGWGATGPDIVEGTVWTQAYADARFEKDFATATQRAINDLGLGAWSALDSGRRAVLIDVAFQTGGAGLAGFVKLLAAVRAHDWPDAAEQLVNSKLYAEVPGREKMNAGILLSGNWPTVEG